MRLPDKEVDMRRRRWIVAVAAVFLVISQISVLAQECTREVSLGEELIRELWSNIKVCNMSVLEKKIAPGFQSVHENGARDREEELKLLKKLNLGEYTLSNFKVTHVGPVIIVSYFASAQETIEGKRLSIKPAARLRNPFVASFVDYPLELERNSKG